MTVALGMPFLLMQLKLQHFALVCDTISLSQYALQETIDMQTFVRTSLLNSD